MYHEEKVINGVLCWRVTPGDEWTQYTAEALTIALTAERGRAQNLDNTLCRIMKKQVAVERAISS